MYHYSNGVERAWEDRSAGFFCHQKWELERYSEDFTRTSQKNGLTLEKIQNLNGNIYKFIREKPKGKEIK